MKEGCSLLARCRPLATVALAAILSIVCAPSVAADAARNLAVQAASASVRKEQHLALVIGNSAYTEAPLLNPVNDARAIAAALEAAGFAVILKTDVDHPTLLAAVREFGDRLRKGGVGIFYFAGHGMQIKGRNYLIPVGAEIQREDEVAYAALDAQAVLDKMETAGNGANLMILDACRNNPFARSFRSSTQGLAQMDAPVGTLVAFSTAPGSVASDGQGSHGMYTEHLLRAMRTPGAKVEDVFKQVRAGVRRDSQGKQIPWEATSLEGDLYFVPPPKVPQVDAGAAVDQAFWAAVKDSGDPADFHAYLRKFPAGRFAPAAKARLATLALAPQQANAGSAAVRPVQAAASANASPSSAPAQAVALAAPTGIAAANPAAPGSSSARKPQPDRRAAALNGSVAGDRWNYQRVDKWKGEVVSNFTRRVASVEPGGNVTFAGEDGYIDPISRFFRSLLEPKAYGHVAADKKVPVWWGDMREGEERKVTMTADQKRDDGSMVPADLALKVERKAVEKVRVPAGEYEAVRLDARGETTWTAQRGNRVTGHWLLRLWYVPELRTVAASEADTYDVSGKLYSRWRDELTSYVAHRVPAPPR